MLAVTLVIVPLSLAILGEPIPTTYVVDSKRKCLQRIVVILVGVGCSIASRGSPPY